MRIIFFNQFAWPDTAATSQFLTDVVRFLADEGHEVEVVSGTYCYASSDEGCTPPAAHFHRVRCFPFSRGSKRLLSYASFFAGAFWKGLRLKPAEIIVTMTTPPMLPLVGTLLAKFRHGRHFIWEMDLFPEALVDTGMLRPDATIIRALAALARYARSHADGVIAPGECMRKRLLERGVPASNVHVAENWADGKSITPLTPRADGPLTILYSGNLGLSHDVETVMYAMDRLKHDRRFHFRFAGDGPVRAKLRDFCDKRGAWNVSFGPGCRRDQLSSALAEGHIGLVTQRRACCGTVVPSKVYGLMAAGRGILYVGPRDATPAQVLRRFGCGWQVDCGDGEGLISLLIRLEAERSEVRKVGDRARVAFLEHYDLPNGVVRVCRIIGAPVARGLSVPVIERT